MRKKYVSFIFFTQKKYFLLKKNVSFIFKICQILAELKCGLIVDPCYIIVGTVHCSENARGTQIPSTSAGWNYTELSWNISSLFCVNLLFLDDTLTDIDVYVCTATGSWWI